MIQKHFLHIITFNIPFPPNYGGIIEIFYKLKALNHLGIKVILHCFHYGRPFPDELKKYCHEIYYYKRKTGIFYQCSKMPYIIITRKNKGLLRNLAKDDYPILFEGHHTTYYINNKQLIGRKKIIRIHNIEQFYYKGLANNEKSLLPKIFFFIEAIKIAHYQKNIDKQELLTLSYGDYDYFKHRKANVHYLPPFHPFDNIVSSPGTGQYILYHGNLAVRENINAVQFILEKIANHISFNIIISGKNPDSKLKSKISQFNNVKLIENPSDAEMKMMIKDAQINLLPTFQNTGVKLKLIAALFLGRHCLVNHKMVEGTKLEKLCYVENEAEEMIESINNLMIKPFIQNDIDQRKDILYTEYDNKKNAERLINLLYNLNL